jgi:hypothetical protein
MMIPSQLPMWSLSRHNNSKRIPLQSRFLCRYQCPNNSSAPFPLISPRIYDNLTDVGDEDDENLENEAVDDLVPAEHRLVPVGESNRQRALVIMLLLQMKKRHGRPLRLLIFEKCIFLPSCQIILRFLQS